MPSRDVTWRAKAACRDIDTSWFFPDGDAVGDADVAAALAVCASCPVRDECLEFALTTRQDDGIWGGTTEAERKRIRRRRSKPAA